MFCPGSHSILEWQIFSLFLVKLRSVSTDYLRRCAKTSPSRKCRGRRAGGDSPLAHSMLTAKLRWEFLTPSATFVPSHKGSSSYALCTAEAPTCTSNTSDVTSFLSQFEKGWHCKNLHIWRTAASIFTDKIICAFMKQSMGIEHKLTLTGWDVEKKLNNCVSSEQVIK